MSVAHDLLTRNLITDTVCNLLDSGATLVFRNAADIDIAILSLDNDAFANAIDGEAVANGFPKQTIAIYANEIKKFVIKDNVGVVKISGTVTIPNGGGDIELAEVNYTIGEIVSLEQLIYRVPYGF
jgi:hypothetical protein